MKIDSNVHRAALLAAAVVALLSGCNQGASSTTTAKRLELGGSLQGEMTTQSPKNLNDGSRYAVADLKLDADTTVQVALSGALKGKLALFDPDGALLATSDTSCDCGGDEAGVSLAYRSTRAGDYQLAVSGVDQNDYGPFRLSSKTFDTRNDGALTLDQPVDGWLERSQDVNQGEAENRYSFAIEQRGIYEFTLSSTDFDAFLALEGNGVSLEDDDGAGGRDARIVSLLEPGEYALVASAIGGDQGLYSLVAQQRQLPEGSEINSGGPITLGGTLTSYYAGRPVEYEFTLEQRQRVTIDMRSSDIDSFLELSGNGVQLSDDDSGDAGNGQGDARIEASLDPGHYRLRARAYSTGAGLFTVTSTVGEALPPGGGDIAVGEAVEVELAPGATDEYRLSITRTGSYTLVMSSGTIDSVLALSGNGVNASDDDSGGNSDARLEVELSPGDYLIEARAYSGEGGAYRLSIQ